MGDPVAGREEQRRPVDAVKPEDVLGDQMPDVGPVTLAQILAGLSVRQRAEVVDERVDPDVDDLVLIPRNRDTPTAGRLG